jgi:hypothetical protein
MQQRLENEPGEGGRRHLNTRSVIALLSIIGVASGIGIVISLGQRPPAAHLVRLPTPTTAPHPITPSPVPLEPQAGNGFSLADDLATHEIVLFGGVGDYANTWLWDGATWTLAHPQVSPGGRFGASEAYDPQTKTVMLFGGRTEPGLPVHDTWAWNGSTWVPLDSGAGGPQPGEGSDMAWDSAVMQMVLLTRSGVISDPAETWIWAGTHWTRPADAALPAGASYSPMWFDPATHSLLAVGCCVGPPPSTGATNTTWRWNGGMWTLLATPAHSPVAGSTMALDPAIDRLVLCSCGEPAVPGTALTVWDGTDWAALPAGRLPVTDGTEITDSDRGELLLVGAAQSVAPSGEPPLEVWRLIGSTWSQLGPAE